MLPILQGLYCSQKNFPLSWNLAHKISAKLQCCLKLKSWNFAFSCSHCLGTLNLVACCIVSLWGNWMVQCLSNIKKIMLLALTCNRNSLMLTAEKNPCVQDQRSSSWTYLYPCTQTKTWFIFWQILPSLPHPKWKPLNSSHRLRDWSLSETEVSASWTFGLTQSWTAVYSPQNSLQYYWIAKGVSLGCWRP